MKLYGSYTSPFVRHCRVALAQEGLECDFVVASYEMSAQQSPSAKVPFFVDGDRMLTDSSSIVKYIRSKVNKQFLADIEEYETYAMINTTLDSAINLFLFESEGLHPDKSAYLKRQQNRINSSLKAIDQRFSRSSHDITHDDALRCACFIDWGLFRNRISLDGLDNLITLLNTANQIEQFKQTAPPTK